MKYNLLDAQRKFIKVPHDYKLDVCCYQGGYGSGKTFCGSLLGILLCRKYPGIRGLVGAYTFPMVRDTTLVSYFQHLDVLGYKKGVHYEYIKSEARLLFKNKSEIIFRYLADESKIKSLNLGFVELEEASELSESTFRQCLARLRQDGIPRYRLFMHTNPQSQKDWIYRTFVEAPKPNYRLIVAPTTQNIYLHDGFLEELKNSYDPDYYRINVLGEFGDYAKGLVVKGFSGDNIQEIAYQPDLPLHICCDFNVSVMAWHLMHRTADKYFFFDELAIENTTTSQSADVLIEKYPDHKGKIVINGDASGDYKRVENELTNYIILKNKLEAHGYHDIEFNIRSFNPPIKNRVASWNSKIRNATGDIGIYIAPACKWLIYNCRNLKYKDGTSIIDLPSHYTLKTDRSSRFLGHFFDAASYPVEFYHPIRADR